MNYYYFDNPNDRSVMVLALSVRHAWNKLRRTHAYYFNREGWTLRKREES